MNKSKKEAHKEKEKAKKQSFRHNQSAKDKEVAIEEAKIWMQSLCQNLSVEENVLASEELRRRTNNKPTGTEKAIADAVKY